MIVNIALQGAKWHAMHGDVSKLAQWLREDRPLVRKDKEFIADLLEGKINPPQQKPIGRPRKTNLNVTMTQIIAWKYYHIADWLRRRGSLYGNSQRLIDSLAEKYGVDPITLANEIGRGRDFRKNRRFGRRQKPAPK